MYHDWQISVPTLVGNLGSQPNNYYWTTYVWPRPANEYWTKLGKSLACNFVLSVIGKLGSWLDNQCCVRTYWIVMNQYWVIKISARLVNNYWIKLHKSLTCNLVPSEIDKIGSRLDTQLNQFWEQRFSQNLLTNTGPSLANRWL